MRRMLPLLFVVSLGSMLWGPPARADLCGDVDGDNLVGVPDFAKVANYLLFDGAVPARVTRSDVNADLMLGVGDLAHFINGFLYGGPPALCYSDELQYRGSVLKQMAQVLRDTLNPHVGGKYQTAGSILGQLNSHIQTLVSEGQPVFPGAMDSVAAMVNDLQSIGSLAQFGDWNGAAAVLGHFTSRFTNFSQNAGLGAINPALYQPFVDAEQNLNTLTAIAGFTADQANAIAHYQDISAAFRLPPLQLQALANALLGISDPVARADLGLDDPQLRSDLATITQFQTDPDVIAWFDSVATAPVAVHTTLTSAGFSNATISLGNSINTGADAMIATTFVCFCGPWADRCTPVCQIRNCMLSKTKVIGWRTTCKLADGKDVTVALVGLIPAGGRAPLKGTVLKAVKTLQKILVEKDELGTRICIKIKWEHCESTWCLWPVFTSNDWVAHESDWDEVPIPNGQVCWPKGSDWPGSLPAITAAIAAKVAAMCAAL